MKHLSLLLTLCLSVSLILGQTMTAYERKCYAVTIPFLKKLGIDESILQKSSKMSDLENLIIGIDFLEKLNTERGLLLMLEYEREMKEAEKLKTAVDFQRDKERKAKAEKEKQIELAKYKERQRQIDREERAKAIKENFENSDYLEIKTSIKRDFEHWLQKDEFEKSQDYLHRITSFSSTAFDSICYHKIVQNMNERDGFKSNLLKYNADTEKFGVEFSFNEEKLYDSISIPLNIATTFKQNFEALEIYVDENNWAFYDNYLTPTKVTLTNKENPELGFYECSFTSKEFKKIAFTSIELGIKTAAFIRTFDFQNYYEKVIFETKDGSAINSLAWECLLNRDFPKAMHLLEKGISVVNKTEDIYPFLITNLAHAYLFNNQFDKAHETYFNNVSLKVDNKTWRSAILQDFEDFKKRGIQSANMEIISKEFASLSIPDNNSEVVVTANNQKKGTDEYLGNSSTNSGLRIVKGLSGRRFTKLPSFESEVNENARVAIDIKVNKLGIVISAEVNPKGTTTTSSAIRTIAIENAKQLRLNESDEEEQIGTILVDFKAR